MNFKNYICVFYNRKNNKEESKKLIYKSILRSTSLQQARIDGQNEFNIFATNQGIEKFSEDIYSLKIFNLENYVNSIPNMDTLGIDDK